MTRVHFLVSRLPHIFVLGFFAIALGGCTTGGSSSSPSSLDALLGTIDISGPISAIRNGQAASSSTSMTAVVPARLASRGPARNVVSTGQKSKALTHNVAATKVGIFSIPPDSYWCSNLQVLSMVPINTDGSFNLPYIASSSANSVIMLVNENATNPTELVAGFLAVPSSAGGDLIELSLDKASGDIDFGALSAGTDSTLLESASSVASLVSSLGESLPTLQKKALFNNGAKRVMNAFVNNSSHGYSFKYFWSSKETIVSLTSASSDSSQYGSYAGYGFEINLPFDAGTLNGIQNRTSTVYLYPPASVTVSNAGKTYTADTVDPVTSGDGMIGAGQSATQDAQGNWIPIAVKLNFGDYIPSMQASGMRLFTGKVPSGMWAMNIDSKSPMGAYDFSIIDPMRPNGQPAVFLPSVSASVDGGGVSTYMVTFSYFDGSGALQSASLVDFASLANNFSLYFGKSSEGSTNSGTVSVVGNSYQVVPGSSGSSFDFSKASMDALSVHYNMYGVEYFFTFYK